MGNHVTISFVFRKHQSCPDTRVGFLVPTKFKAESSFQRSLIPRPPSSFGLQISSKLIHDVCFPTKILTSSKYSLDRFGNGTRSKEVDRKSVEDMLDKNEPPYLF